MHMKNPFAYLALPVCLFFAQQNFAQNCSRNLLSNTGFETGNTKGWHKLLGGPGASASIAPNALAHSGGSAFALRSASIWQSVNVVPGIKYTLRVWAKATAADNSAYIHFNIFGPTAPLGSKVMYVNSLDYQEHTLELVAPAGAIRVDASATAAGVSTALFVDDFCLVESFALTLPAGANLLQNGDFEQIFSGWDGWVSGYSHTASAGLRSVAFCSNQDFCQTVAVCGGQKFTLQFKSQAGTTGAEVIGCVQFFSAENRPLARQWVALPARACPNWGAATLSAIAPTGATWAEVGFFMEKQGCLLVDEASFFTQPGEDRPMPAADSTASAIEGRLKIFPNPAHESAFVDVSEFEGKENLRLVIFDGKGLIVKSLRIDEAATPLLEISLSNLPDGLYFARLFAPGLRPTTAKLVVQHTF